SAQVMMNPMMVRRTVVSSPWSLVCLEPRARLGHACFRRRTPKLTCRRKPQRRRREGWRRSGAVPCSAGDVPLGRQRSTPYHGTLRLWASSLRPLSHPAQMPGTHLLDDLVRKDQERWWHRDPECLGSLEVDHQLELRGLLD